ncbi:MAG: hydrogenase maturation nickel metallochaperone HypA [Terracidiphilus sp.]|nr:hydrogenase maturation nickel metallochaperone HypA [Terracidiphilus sp.]
MHELSLVSSIVDAVTESLAPYPGARVKEVRLRVGALAAVEEESLQFCYGIATEDTSLAGSALVVSVVPVGGYCASCAKDVEIASLRSFRCPLCGGPVENTSKGRELEIESIEIEDEEETVQS